MKIEIPITPKDEKYWNEFAKWWSPKNSGEPQRDDPATWEKYQYYCAGRLDERTDKTAE
jgi:hypothetical protein